MLVFSLNSSCNGMFLFSEDLVEDIDCFDKLELDRNAINSIQDNADFLALADSALTVIGVTNGLCRFCELFANWFS